MLERLSGLLRRAIGRGGRAEVGDRSRLRQAWTSGVPSGRGGKVGEEGEGVRGSW